MKSTSMKKAKSSFDNLVVPYLECENLFDWPLLSLKGL